MDAILGLVVVAIGLPCWVVLGCPDPIRHPRRSWIVDVVTMGVVCVFALPILVCRGPRNGTG